MERKSKRARHVRRRRRRPVSQRDQSIHGPHERLLYDLSRRVFRLVEPDGNCAVRPRIVQLVAAVAREHDVNPESARSFRETPRLVS
jgi:hypothetical protein